MEDDAPLRIKQAWIEVVPGNSIMESDVKLTLRTIDNINVYFLMSHAAMDALSHSLVAGAFQFRAIFPEGGCDDAGTCNHG